MKSETKIITCPRCGTRQEFVMFPTINGANHDLREKFLDGSLTTLTCSQCGFSGVVEYPLVYHDIEDKFSIYFEPDTDTRVSGLSHMLPAHLEGEFRLRLVHTQDDLREKIYIFRDKLDDRIVELVKDAILKEMEMKKEEKLPDALYYAEDRFACEGRSLIFVPKKDNAYLDPIKIPFTTYENIKKMMSGIWEREVKGYSVVDKQWVRDV
ncbi:MAG TPA: CpXC domain-containing protein [Methanocorpusculum sp.]|nr:CpXC domain-containing protein [Methanocorpusculum sp.]